MVLKEVLLPFVIAVFFTFLLRPLVNLLTTPFARVCPCCAVPSVLPQPRQRGRGGAGGGYSRLPPSRMGTESAESMGVPGEGAREGGGGGGARRPRAPSPAKYPRTMRGMMTRICANAQDMYHTAASAGGGGGGSGSGSGGGSSGRVSPSPASFPLDEQDCSCCCGGAGGYCTFTRCPRWFAVLVSLCVAMGVLGGLILMIADAIQRFQQESLSLFVDEASLLVDRVQDWLSVFGIHVEGAAILEAIKQSISVPFLVQTTVTVVVDGVGNALLVLLLVLYLLAEASTHAPGSLRAKVDDQIQRYVVIKTVISVLQGLLAYIILGVMLHVRMAHLFGEFFVSSRGTN